MQAFVPHVAAGRSPLMRWGAGLALAAFFAVGLAWLALRWWLWPAADALRPQVVAELSHLLGRPVAIERIVTGFDGWLPRIELEGLAVTDDDGRDLLRVPAARAELALRSFVVGAPRFALIEIDRPTLVVERGTDGGWRIGGVALRPDGTQAPGQGLDLLLAQRRVRLHDATLVLRERGRGIERRLAGIELALGSVGRRHRLSLAVADAGGIAGRLDAALEFTRAPLSHAGDWLHWNGQVYVGAEGLDIAALLPFTGPLPLTAGRGNLRAWSGFADGVPSDLLVKVDAADLLAAQAEQAGTRRWPGIERLSAEARIVRADGGGWALRLDRASATVPGSPPLVARGEQELWIDAQGQPRSGRIALEPFSVADALALVRRLPLSAPARERLAQTRAEGRVDRFEFSFNRGDQPGYDAEIAFTDLTLNVPDPRPIPDDGHIHPRLPTAENLSGTLRMREDRGELAVSGRQAALSFPGVFAEPRIPFDRFEAQGGWQLGRDASQPALTIEIQRATFANADAAGEARATWRSQPGGPGVIDVEAKVGRADATRIHRYLPVGVPEPVRAWARRAVVAGHSEDTRLKIRGDLWEFPFRDPAKGEFLIESQVADATLAYAPDWPPIEHLGGTVRFERGGMQIVARGGRIFGLTLSDARAGIEDFRQPLLTIDGDGQGPVQDMLRFVNESPVRVRIDDFTRDTRADGPARLQLSLGLPFGALERTRVAGVVTFDGNTITLDRTIPTFSDVHGRLEFGERGLALRGIDATFLEGPITVDGETPEPGRFLLKANGRIGAEAMRHVVDNALTRRLSGQTAYRAQVDVRRRASTLTIDSDLEGLAIELPPPFTKPAAARWPLTVVSRPTTPPEPDARPAGDLLEVTLRDQARLAFERTRDPATQRMRVRRGAFAFDTEPVLPASGLQASVRAPMLDLDQWSAVAADVRADAERAAARAEADARAAEAKAGDMKAGETKAAETKAAENTAAENKSADSQAPAGGTSAVADVRTAGGAAADDAGAPVGYLEGFSLLPSAVSVVTDELRIGGKSLHQVVFGATRSGGDWQANVNAREVNGHFNWRDPVPGQRAGTLYARFGRLEIPPSRRGEIESLLESTPRTLPALDVEADELVLGEIALGRLRLKAANEGSDAAPVWALSELKLDHPAGWFSAAGRWGADARGRRAMRLDYELDVIDGGGLLEAVGVKHALSGGAGRIAGRVAWDGSPLAIDFPSLSGRLSVNMGHGQFLKTDPGLAKLVGVLNLQSLPRRLTLDFRDVFAEGFAFDEIAGDVTIAGGVARTEALSMRGVQAQVTIGGEADLARETQSLSVQVRPEINAGLASLAYAAAVNPAIGLGSFVAQVLLRRPLTQIFTYDYEVRGSWTDPVVREKRRPVPPAVVPSAP